MKKDKKNRVFISYSYYDKEYGEKITNALRYKGIEVFIDLDPINTGSYFFKRLQYLFESSDTVLILISKKFNDSTLTHKESEDLFNFAKKRKISIIPVQIENCNIPDSLQNYQTINISKNFEKGIDSIIRKLEILPDIDFDKFSPSEFINFVHDLLGEIGFKNLIWSYSDHYDFGYDLMGTYWNKDPFGLRTRETWLIEIKFYRSDRFSINSIIELFNLYYSNKDPNTKVLLVTNSILTSTAEEYLNDIKTKKNFPVTILDGNALKKLVLKRKSIINKYFRK
ncbi:MAG: TIR domain-containing protein [Ignavibacteriae bacterium]|nr:TIR domain-containing protein [Ignavibacteriota bacterium]